MYLLLDENEYSRWIASAKKTLESARGDQARGDYNWACFKAQQAGGLAAKALLHGIGEAAYGHSVSRLLSNASTKGFAVPEEVMDCGRDLDKYYIPTRYPSAWSEGSPHEYYSERDGARAIYCAEIIISWVEEQWESLKRGGD